VQGEFQPGGDGRDVRRRGADDPPPRFAALRRSRPVPGEVLAPVRAECRARRTPGTWPRRVDARVEQLAGVPLPASALESLILPGPGG